MDRSTRIFLGALGLAAALAALAYISDVNYLLFHSLVEGYSVAIAFGIFFLAWNSRGFVKNNYLLFLGVAYPFIGLLDFLHLLSYRDMGVFQGHGANLPTQLWIQARYLEAVTLFLAPLFFRRKIREHLVLTVYGAVTALLLWTVLQAGIFPDCFVEPGGLTPFKRVSEYVISLILLASLVMVVRRRDRIGRTTFLYLSASIATTIAAELAFTFYISVYGFSNMVGHLLKILSFYFIYKGIIEACLRDPYSSLFLELKRSEEKLRRVEEELRSRNFELESFLHTAAHDLRTPLMSIGGYAEVLERTLDRGDPGKREEMIRQIKNSVKRLNTLLKDLLDFAFVGRKAATPVEVDTAKVIEAILEEKREEISASGARIVRPDRLPSLYMPETEVYQLFANLISNSLKFHRPGLSPVITLGVGEVVEGGYGTITVSDNGTGIAEGDLDRIFDLFVTLQGEGARGSGAGLAIVKRIVQANGGSVRVQSRVGEGTTFILSLPVA